MLRIAAPAVRRPQQVLDRSTSPARPALGKAVDLHRQQIDLLPGLDQRHFVPIGKIQCAWRGLRDLDRVLQRVRLLHILRAVWIAKRTEQRHDVPCTD